MKSKARRNQPGWGPWLNDQGVVRSASKFRWHRMKGHWNGKTFAKTVQKRRDRRAGKREARDEG